jgi:dTDP-4-amino-4,6-dideoxygalactose transaminase
MVPGIEQEDIDALVTVLRSGMLIQGPRVEEFENNIARYLGVRHAVAVSNGTATLHLALVALGLQKGDEVIVPAFSYMATANVVELTGATPVFVDIDIDTFNIDTALLEKAISPKTKAIIPVHEFGLACDIGEVCRIAARFGIPVIEDAACALGAREDGKCAGTFGRIGSFSFHPRKAITSGEGGMLVTNDDELARKLRILRNHGIEVQEGKMEFPEAGYNYRMTDFQAALVNSQFHRLETILLYKDKLASIYLDRLNCPGFIRLPQVPYNKRHTWQSFHILLEDGFDRDKMIAVLKEKGIGTNYGAQCMPYQQYFRHKYDLNCEELFPNALQAYRQGLVLPLYEKMDDGQVQQVIQAIHETRR